MNERILEPNDEFMRNATEINDKLRTISKKIIGHSLSTLKRLDLPRRQVLTYLANPEVSITMRRWDL